MATGEDRVPGPDHRLEINREDNVVMDEVSGTPPFIPAQVRSTIYIIMLVVDVLAVVVLGLLPLIGVMEFTMPNAIAGLVVLALNMINTGLSVGYRPTRPGSPVAPEVK